MSRKPEKSSRARADEKRVTSSDPFATLNAWLSRPSVGWALSGVLAVVYSLAYVQHELFPGTGAEALTRGWWTWSDQQRYLQQATAIADGKLDAQSYFYPPGYAALGAVFVRAMPANPFFLPNVALVLGAAAMGWRLARRWLSPVAVLATGIMFVATHRWLVADAIVVPWNTLVTLCTLPAGIYLVTAQRGPRVVWQLAGLAAATYWTRPVDAVAFAPLLAFATWRLPTWRARMLHGGGAAAVVLGAWAALGGLNMAIFGSWRTPYETASLEVLGFFGYPTSYKLYWLFLDGQSFFEETDSALLWRYPWLWFALPTAVWWWRRERGAGAAAICAIVVNTLVYVSYNDFVPSGTYRFTLIHYLVWWFPLVFVGSVAALRNGWRERAVRLALAASALLAFVGAGLRLEAKMAAATPVGEGWVVPARRPLVVHLPGLLGASIPRLRLDGRPLVEPAQYLVAYIRPDVKVLLGEKAPGASLTLAPGVAPPEPPQVGTLHWRWRMSGNRVAKIGRRIIQHASN